MRNPAGRLPEPDPAHPQAVARDALTPLPALAGEANVEQYLRKLHWENVSGYLSSIGLPYYVTRLADGGVAMLPGVSNLNELR